MAEEAQAPFVPRAGVAVPARRDTTRNWGRSGAHRRTLFHVLIHTFGFFCSHVRRSEDNVERFPGRWADIGDKLLAFSFCWGSLAARRLRGGLVALSRACVSIQVSSGRSEMQAFQAQRLAAFWAALLVPRALW